MIQPEIVAAIAPVTAAFDRLNRPYYIGGSVASTAYGEVRTTNDIDLVADLKHADAALLAEWLAADYYADRRTMEESIAQQSCFNLIHLPTGFKVDVFAMRGRPIDRSAMHRATLQPADVGDNAPSFRIASPEDTILAKLEWFELTNRTSERQWRDILGVIRSRAEKLDRGYLLYWAAEVGLAALLEEAFADSEFK